MIESLNSVESLTVEVTTPEGGPVLKTIILGCPDLDQAHHWATVYHRIHVNCVVTLTYTQVISPKEDNK